jgi:hypothetical protein
LVVSHGESFLDALLLVAAIDRPVRCVIQARLVQGLLAPLLARGLGMISISPEEERLALEKCFAALAGRAALMTFVDPGQARLGEENGIASAAASLAVEAESRNGGGLGLLLFPVHVFLPVGRTQMSELLIDIDQPEAAQDYLSAPGGAPHDQARELAKALARRCQQNSFRLQPANLADFLADLETALRIDFEEGRPAPLAQRQKVNEFELSRFVVDWAEQLNYLNPGLLVSLRESLEAWRRACRLCSLHRLEVEGAGAWLNWPVGRGVAWLESVVGVPLALYGLINHLGAAVLLYLAGLLKKGSGRDRVVEWVARGLIVSACYAVQIFLVARSWGRRAAGYYAPSLPLSALYLWRYTWLLRYQTRIAFLSLNLSAEAAKTTRLRKDFLREINEALKLQAETLGFPQ